MKVEVKRIILRGTCQCCVVAAWSVLVQDSPLSLPYFSVSKKFWNWLSMKLLFSCCRPIKNSPWALVYQILLFISGFWKNHQVVPLKAHLKFSKAIKNSPRLLVWNIYGEGRADEGQAAANWPNLHILTIHLERFISKALSIPWPLSMWNESTPQRTFVLKFRFEFVCALNNKICTEVAGLYFFPG